jgi:hypothetical protein
VEKFTLGRDISNGERPVVAVPEGFGRRFDCTPVRATR